MPTCSVILRLAFALALAAGLPSAIAQSRFSIRGTVADATGAAVSAAGIELQSPAGFPVAHTLSTATGEFDLPGIPAGSYILSIPAINGFAPQNLPLRISASISSLKIKLSLESVAQTVDVGNAQPLSPEAADNKDAVALSGNDLQKLPVFDQDYIAALTPFLDPESVSSDGVTVLVDGVEMKGSTVSPSAITEVLTNSDPYSAEFGRPGRGHINIITKPGSPDFHGTLNFIARDAIFNAKLFFAPPFGRRSSAASTKVASLATAATPPFCFPATAARMTPPSPYTPLGRKASSPPTSRLRAATRRSRSASATTSPPLIDSPSDTTPSTAHVMTSNSLRPKRITLRSLNLGLTSSTTPTTPTTSGVSAHRSSSNPPLPWRAANCNSVSVTSFSARRHLASAEDQRGSCSISLPCNLEQIPGGCRGKLVWQAPLALRLPDPIHHKKIDF
jgi:hypothetical protein